MLPVSDGVARLPRGVTRKVDDGMRVTESWLISVTENIATDHTPLRSVVHTDGISGFTGLINWLVTPSSRPNSTVLFFNNKHCDM